jgi:hypothetical protein
VRAYARPELRNLPLAGRWRWGLYADLDVTSGNYLDSSNLVEVNPRVLFGAGGQISAPHWGLRLVASAYNLANTPVVDFTGYPCPAALGLSHPAMVHARHKQGDIGMSTRSRLLDMAFILSLPALWPWLVAMPSTVLPRMQPQRLATPQRPISPTPLTEARTPRKPPILPTPEPVGLAVIHGSSDYTSSLLSLVDPATATLVHDNCLNSGSVAPQLSQALSGSVVLPSAPLPGHPLVLIDSTNGSLVWVNPADCTVVRQLSVSTGFKAYPHDVVAVSPNKFYVTRYMTNSSPTADPSDLDEGGDLLILDLDLGKAVARIDLAPYAAGGAGINPNPTALAFSTARSTSRSTT